MVANHNDDVIRALAERKRDFAAFVQRRVPAADVADVLQLAALRALESACTIRDSARIEGWLFRVHRNVVADFLRRRKTELRFIDTRVNSGAVEMTNETVSPTCACSIKLARELPAKLSSVLLPMALDGDSLPEVAKRLGISTNHASVRLHRARIELRSRMARHCGVEAAKQCRDCRCSYEGCCIA
jgi:RNA polymerase sigma-70 factor (ECF subfamily)